MCLLSACTPETADFGVLRASLPFRTRGTILSANYLDLFSRGRCEGGWGWCGYKDRAVKYTQGTPGITGSLTCQSGMEGSSFASLVVPVMLLQLHYCLPWLRRRKQSLYCKDFQFINESTGFSIFSEQNKSLQMATCLLVTSQARWPYTVPPGTLAHCR